MDIYSTVNYMRQNHKTIFDLNIRVTYYARVSTLKEEQDSSIEHQIEHFNQLISEHKNWTYVEGYVDRVRGESASNRENFLRMIEDGKEGKFDLVLTKEVSRFARNTIDSLTYTRELLRYGVGVLFQNDNICTVDSDAEFRLTIMASIAQDEVRKLSERVRFGHKQSIEKGVVMGNSRIYGYDKQNGKLVINEKEAEMIRFIFEQYSSGLYAIRAIQRQLFEKGYKSRSGTQISHTTLCGIITNPKYKGYYCGNKVKIADYRTKEQVFLPEDQWITYKDETGEIVPAIVSEAVWNRANALYKKRSEEVKNRGHGNKTTSVLSGKIICAHHNTPFWRTSYSHALHRDENIYQWICREKKTQKSSACPTFAIYETELYELLGKCYLESMKQFKDYTESFISIYQSVIADNTSKLSLDKLIAEKEAVEHKKEMLLDLYVGGDIPKDDFRKKNDSLISQINELQIKIDSLKDSQTGVQDIKKRIDSIREIITNMLSNTDGDSLSNEEIDNLSGMFLERVEVKSLDNRTLELNVVMNVGEIKGSLNRSSGVIIQKILPEQQLSTSRTFGRNIVPYTIKFNISAII